MEKAAVFIDGGYLDKICKKKFSNDDGEPPEIDLGKLGQLLASKANAKLKKTYFYHCPPYISPSPTEEERGRQSNYDKFIEALENLDKFQVRLGNLRKFYDENGEPEYEQKGVDVRIAIDAIKLALKSRINKAIFLTGDSDFVPVIEAIKDEGIDTILFYHESSIHRNLLKTVDTKKTIDEDLMEGSKRED